MWLAKVTCLVVVVLGSALGDYELDRQGDDDDDGSYVYSAEDGFTPTPLWWVGTRTRSSSPGAEEDEEAAHAQDAGPRVRRDNNTQFRTLSANEMKDVKGALENILAARNLDGLLDSESTPPGRADSDLPPSRSSLATSRSPANRTPTRALSIPPLSLSSSDPSLEQPASRSFSTTAQYDSDETEADALSKQVLLDALSKYISEALHMDTGADAGAAWRSPLRSTRSPLNYHKKFFDYPDMMRNPPIGLPWNHQEKALPGLRQKAVTVRPSDINGNPCSMGVLKDRSACCNENTTKSACCSRGINLKGECCPGGQDETDECIACEDGGENADGMCCNPNSDTTQKCCKLGVQRGRDGKCCDPERGINSRGDCRICPLGGSERNGKCCNVKQDRTGKCCGKGVQSNLLGFCCDAVLGVDSAGECVLCPLGKFRSGKCCNPDTAGMTCCPPNADIDEEGKCCDPTLAMDTAGMCEECPEGRFKNGTCCEPELDKSKLCCAQGSKIDRRGYCCRSNIVDRQGFCCGHVGVGDDGLCITTTTPKPLFDIPALLAVIANLTYDYDTELVRWVNISLQKWSIPTCPPGTTSTSTSTTAPTTTMGYDYEGNFTGTIVAKCFVCGLEIEGIPRNAHCADAFAGDFLPLVPVDPTARGQIAIYRKYCRYMDVPAYHYNSTDPRSLWGRWTGGCAVRWTDLTGVYTQRACRNRNHALMGRHFVSKRMAKLEMALQHIDEGCIISPMASLVPLSRGISLYARFHACVCTGNWCNRAPHNLPWTPLIALLPICLCVRHVAQTT